MSAIRAVQGPRLCAYVLAALVVIEIVAVGVVAATTGQPMTRHVVGSVLSLFPLALGLVVAGRQPGNWVGPLLVLIAPLAIALSLGDLTEPVMHPAPALQPLWNVYVGISPGAWMWLFVPPALLVLVFPDGRPPGRRWRASGTAS